MAYKMKAGGKRKPSKSMDSFIEPSKELKFGGPRRYVNGGGMGSAGKQANYGSRNKNAEAKNKADNDLLTTVEKLTLSPGEKQEKIAERKNKGKVSVTPIQRSVARSQAAQQLRDKKAKNKEAAEFYTRGQVGTPKKASGNNTNQGKASTTSGIPNVGRPLKSNSSKPAPKPAPKQTSTPAKKPAASTPPKAAPQSVNRVQAKSVPTKPVEQKLQTKPKMANYDALIAASNKSESTPTSKKAQRIDRRAKKVTDRKSKDRMANKAARINKRAANVEARKEKKSEVTAAKARLKAARRLKYGGN